MQDTRYFCRILMKFDFFSTESQKKCSNIKFHENQSSENRDACGQTQRQMEEQTNV